MSNGQQSKTDLNEKAADLVKLFNVDIDASKKENCASNELEGHGSLKTAYEISTKSSTCQSAIDNSAKTAVQHRWYDGANPLKTTYLNSTSRPSSVGSQSSDWPNTSDCQTAEERSSKTPLVDSRSPSSFNWSLGFEKAKSYNTSRSNLSSVTNVNYSSARSPSLLTPASPYSRFRVSPCSMNTMNISTGCDSNTESTQYSNSSKSSLPNIKGPEVENRSHSRSIKANSNSMQTAAGYSQLSGESGNVSPAKEDLIQRLLNHSVHKSVRNRSPSGSPVTLGLSRSSSAPPTEIIIPRSTNVALEGSETEANNQVMTMKTLPDGTIEVTMNVSVSAPGTTSGRLYLSGMAPEGYTMSRFKVKQGEMSPIE